MPRGDCKAGGLFIVSFWDRQVPACSCAVFCFLRRTLVAPSACREHFQRKQHRLKTCGGPGNHKFSISVDIDLSVFLLPEERHRTFFRAEFQKAQFLCQTLFFCSIRHCKGSAPIRGSGKFCFVSPAQSCPLTKYGLTESI